LVSGWLAEPQIGIHASGSLGGTVTTTFKFERPGAIWRRRPSSASSSYSECNHPRVLTWVYPACHTARRSSLTAWSPYRAPPLPTPPGGAGVTWASDGRNLLCRWSESVDFTCIRPRDSESVYWQGKQAASSQPECSTDLQSCKKKHNKVTVYSRRCARDWQHQQPPPPMPPPSLLQTPLSSLRQPTHWQATARQCSSASDSEATHRSCTPLLPAARSVLPTGVDSRR
jgi:hypothetical protein